MSGIVAFALIQSVLLDFRFLSGFVLAETVVNDFVGNDFAYRAVVCNLIAGNGTRNNCVFSDGDFSAIGVDGFRSTGYNDYICGNFIVFGGRNNHAFRFVRNGNFDFTGNRDARSGINRNSICAMVFNNDAVRCVRHDYSTFRSGALVGIIGYNHSASRNRHCGGLLRTLIVKNNAVKNEGMLRHGDFKVVRSVTVFKRNVGVPYNGGVYGVDFDLLGFDDFTGEKRIFAVAKIHFPAFLGF